MNWDMLFAVMALVGCVGIGMISWEWRTPPIARTWITGLGVIFCSLGIALGTVIALYHYILGWV